jgi:hypothetical protein
MNFFLLKVLLITKEESIGLIQESKNDHIYSINPKNLLILTLEIEGY